MIEWSIWERVCFLLSVWWPFVAAVVLVLIAGFSIWHYRERLGPSLWGAVLALIVLATFVVVPAWSHCNREWHRMSRRLVVILLDNTGSMVDSRNSCSPMTFAHARNLVDKLIKQCRPELDTIHVRKIPSKFVDSDCDLKRSRGRIVVDVPTSPGATGPASEGGSDYKGALMWAMETLNGNPIEEKYLFVVGDLAPQSTEKPVVVYEPMVAASDKVQELHGVAVVLLHPSTRMTPELQRMWSRYLSDCGCETFRFYPISSAQDNESFLKKLFLRKSNASRATEDEAPPDGDIETQSDETESPP